MTLTNQLESLLKCWFYYMDSRSEGESYVDVCKNVSYLEATNQFDHYAFKWSAVSSMTIAGGLLGSLFQPLQQHNYQKKNNYHV